MSPWYDAEATALAPSDMARIRALYPVREPVAPDEVTAAVANEDASAYCARELTPALTAGLEALCRARPANPVEWLGEWLNVHKAP